MVEVYSDASEAREQEAEVTKRRHKLIDVDKMKVLGVYNTFFETSAQGPDVNTQTVNTAVYVEINLPRKTDITKTDDIDSLYVKLDHLHSNYKWESSEEFGKKKYTPYVEKIYEDYKKTVKKS